MKFFALETDISKIKQRFCHEAEGECEVLTTHYHGLSFLFAIVREVFITIFLFGVGVTGFYLQWPMFWLLVILVCVWVFFVFFNVMKAYIDWYFDFIFVTTDKIVLVDQTSFFHQKVNPIHIENIGSVTAETQFWGIFGFGCIRINLKEGEGGSQVKLDYVPNADVIAGQISDVVTQFQRHGPRGRHASQVPPQGGQLGVTENA